MSYNNAVAHQSLAMLLPEVTREMGDKPGPHAGNEPCPRREAGVMCPPPLEKPERSKYTESLRA